MSHFESTKFEYNSCPATPRSVERLEEEKEIPIFEKILGIKVIEFDIKTTNNEENTNSPIIL